MAPGLAAPEVRVIARPAPPGGAPLRIDKGSTMTDATPKPGTIGWFDLTVPDATAIRDFYAAVVGWEAVPISMGDYDDFAMIPAGAAEPVGGICYARGENAAQPPVWMAYMIVTDLDERLRRSAELGGTQVTAIREAGPTRFAVMQDPAGAYFALMETTAEPA